MGAWRVEDDSAQEMVNRLLKDIMNEENYAKVSVFRANVMNNINVPR